MINSRCNFSLFVGNGLSSLLAVSVNYRPIAKINKKKKGHDYFVRNHDPFSFLSSHNLKVLSKV